MIAINNKYFKNINLDKNSEFFEQALINIIKTGIVSEISEEEKESIVSGASVLIFNNDNEYIFSDYFSIQQYLKNIYFAKYAERTALFERVHLSNYIISNKPKVAVVNYIMTTSYLNPDLITEFQVDIALAMQLYYEKNTDIEKLRETKGSNIVYGYTINIFIMFIKVATKLSSKKFPKIYFYNVFDLVENVQKFKKNINEVYSEFRLRNLDEEDDY